MKILLLISFVLIFVGCHQEPDPDNSNEILLDKVGGYFPIKEYGRWGYINSDGKIVIECQFHHAQEFFEGLAPVLIDSLWGFIDTTGTIVIKPQFINVSQFSNGLCHVTIQNDTVPQGSFIRSDGSIAFNTSHRVIGDFRYGMCKVEIENEICFLNTKGEIIYNTHLIQSRVSEFSEGILKLYEYESTGKLNENKGENKGSIITYVDTSWNVLAEIKGEGGGYGDFSEGVALVTINGTQLYMDKNGRTKFTPSNQNLTYFDFSNGLAKALRPDYKSTIGFIDATGELVIPTIYAGVKDFSEGLAAFRSEEAWGFIDIEGNVVIDPIFQQVSTGFSNGLCKIKKDHQWGYINKKGEVVWKEQVGLEYTKLDLSKWNLDTLELTKPFPFDKFAGGDNYPRKGNFNSLSKVTLYVDTLDITVFEDKYFAYKLYLVNASPDSVEIPLQDSRIKITQEAKNQVGEWESIDLFLNSFCGNSYHSLRLAPNEYQVFPTPIFKGNYNTLLRFKLELEQEEIYSEPYSGQINYQQLMSPKYIDELGLPQWMY